MTYDRMSIEFIFKTFRAESPVLPQRTLDSMTRAEKSSLLRHSHPPKSLDRVVTSSFITGQNTIPLPVGIHNYIQTENDPTIPALSTILICFSFGIISVVNKLVGLEKIVVAE